MVSQSNPHRGPQPQSDATAVDVNVLVETIAAERMRTVGRPLHVADYPFPRSSGARQGIDAIWLAFADCDWIVVNADAGERERVALITREAERMAAGYESLDTPEGLDAAVAALAPLGLGSQLVRRMLG